MPMNIAAAALAASGFWAISTWTVFTADTSSVRELWTVTSSDKVRSHPALVRASVPRSLASARDAYVARARVASAGTSIRN